MGRRRGSLASSVLLAASIFEAGVPLVRNIVLARLMIPSEFGLAITLAVVISLVEILTDLGIPILALRRLNGIGARETLATLHSLALARSLLIGLFLIATAPLIARSLHVPAATWAFAALGAVAALRGFENLGVKSMLRANQFSPEASVIAVSQVALLVVTVAAAWWTGRYDCILWGMLAQTIAVVGLSHVVSPRRWRLGFNRVVIKEALRFGRPLLIGGAAASVATSDRLIVGAVLGPAAIAVYNVAVGSAMLPRSVMARFVTSALVPLFSRKSMHADKAAPLADAWAFGLSCTALVYGLAIALAGGPVLGAVFGPVYQPSQLFMTILGLAVCIRILMLLPVPPSLARGDASLVTLASIAPAIAVLLATPILIVSRDPSSFLLTSSIVELLALFWLTRKIAVRLSFSPAPLRLLAVGPPVTLTVLVIATLLAPDNSTSYAVIICSVALVIVTGAYLTIHRRYGIQLSAALP